MSNYTDVATRWLDVALGKTDKGTLSNRRMIASGDSIYSYGTHFEMARVLRDRKGRPTHILVNGDRFSNTTSGHQAIVRRVIQQSGLPSVIIPFTALNAAGIRRNDVEIVSVEADRTEVKHHETTTLPEGAFWHTYDVEGYVDYSPEQLAAIVARKNAEHAEEWERKRGYVDDEPHTTTDGVSYNVWTDWLQRNPTPKTITVDDLDHWSRQVWAKIGEETILHFGRRQEASWRRVVIDVMPLDDGTTRYSWDTSRHWLGESVIKAKVSWTGRTRCKPCKGTGENPDKPEGAVRRWDDGFMCSTCRGAGGRTFRRTRSSYFLSGFDHEETTPLYFFCELPKGVKPTTVAEAYDTLKPEAVRLAEQIGRPVIRQGDVYAIALQAVDKRSLRRQGATFVKRGTLLNTSHEATEVAYLPDGTTLARGVLHHNPDFRRPDHRRRRLTPGWNVVIKNTVPFAA